MLETNMNLYFKEILFGQIPNISSQIVTDDAGTKWMIYHSYRKNNPDLGRLLMFDRLLWTDDGWSHLLKKEPSEQEIRPMILNSKEKE